MNNGLEQKLIRGLNFHKVFYAFMVLAFMVGCKGEQMVLTMESQGSFSVITFSISDVSPASRQPILLSVNLSCSGGFCEESILYYLRSTNKTISMTDTAVGNGTMLSLKNGKKTYMFTNTHAPESGVFYYGICIKGKCTEGIMVEIQGMLSFQDFSVNSRTSTSEEEITLSTTIRCTEGPCATQTLRYYLIQNDNSTPIGNSTIPKLRKGENHNLNFITQGPRTGNFSYRACIENRCMEGITMEVRGSLFLHNLNANNTSPQTKEKIMLTTEVSCTEGPCSAQTLRYYLIQDDNSTLSGNSTIPKLGKGENHSVNFITQAPRSGTFSYRACIEDRCIEGITMEVSGSLSLHNLNTNNTSPQTKENIMLTTEVSCTEGPCATQTLRYYLIQNDNSTLSGNSTIPELRKGENHNLNFITQGPRSGNFSYRACIVNYCIEGITMEVRGSLSLHNLNTNNTSPQTKENIMLTTEVSCTEGPCSTQTLRYYLIQNNDSTLSGNSTIPKLGKGENHSVNFITQAPNSGNFSYRACIENRCINSALLKVQPTLIITAFNVSNIWPRSGENITLSAIITCGGGPCPKENILYYHSQNKTFGEIAMLIGNHSIRRLENNESLIHNINITVRERGSYYYGTCIQNKCTASVRVTANDTDKDGYADEEDADDDGNDLIEIRNAAELNNIRLALNISRPVEGIINGSLNLTGCTSTTGCIGYELMADIDLAGFGDEEQGWDPIGVFNTRDGFETFFSGVFDGNNHTIRNLFINKTNEIRPGFFRKVGQATIKNVFFDNVRVIGTIQVGALAGVAEQSDITNVFMRGNVSAEDEFGRRGTAGGLIGFALAGTNIVNSGAIGHVRGSWTGGLVGYMRHSTVTGSYARGTINGINRVGGLIGLALNSRIIGSYAESSIHAQDEVGGLVGQGQGSRIIGSYAKSTIHARDQVGGLVGDDFYARSGGVDHNIKIIASYSKSNIHARDKVGGIMGSGRNTTITASYAAGLIQGNRDLGGLLGHKDILEPTIMNSYWDKNATNISSGRYGEAKTAEELKKGSAGIYEEWNQLCPQDNTSPIWNFGTQAEYPAIQCTPHGVNIQRNGSLPLGINTAENGSLSLGTLRSSNNIPNPAQAIQLFVNVSCSQGWCSPARIRYYAAADPYVTPQDRYVGENFLPSLLSGEKRSLVIKTSAPAAGMLYYAACFRNQCTDGISIEIQGRLSVRDLSVNATLANPGEKVRISLNTTCIEGRICLEDILSYHKSEDENIERTDAILGISNVASLEEGETGTYHIDIRAPQTPQTDVFYYGVCTEHSCTYGVRVLIDEDRDGYAPNEDIDDDGDGLIEIRTAEQLDKIRWSLDGSGYKTNETGINKTTGCPQLGCRGYELTANIDLAGFGKYAHKGWMPIGNITSPFNAVFAGNNYMIRNVFINRTDLNYVGLFSSLAAAAALRNIRLENVNITGNSSVGGFAGQAIQAAIINSEVRGEITGNNDIGGLVGNSHQAIFINATIQGKITGTNGIGGLVGRGHEATILSSAVRGKVAGHSFVGGVIGDGTNTNVTASWSMSNVAGQDNVGGLIGYGHQVKITSSYSRSNVTGTNYLGGLAGNVRGSHSQLSIIDSSYAVGIIKGQGANVGGLVGAGNRETRIIASYWDSDVSGLSSGDYGEPQTSLELQIGARDIYAEWTQTCPKDRMKAVWDFGSTEQYPAIQCTRGGANFQRYFFTAGEPNPRNRGTLSLENFAVSNGKPTHEETLRLSVRARCDEGFCLPAKIEYYVSENENITRGDEYVGETLLASFMENENANLYIETDAPARGIHYYGACIEKSCSTGVQVSVRGVLSIGKFSANNTSPEPSETFQLSIVVSCDRGPCREDTLYYFRSQDEEIVRGEDALADFHIISALHDGYTGTRKTNITAEDFGIFYYGVCLGEICSNGIEVSAGDRDRDGYRTNEDVDDDGDGLIEVRSSQELQNMRWTPDGSGYRESATDDIDSTGCPELRCTGYELISAIDLDGFGTRRRGWMPIGNMTSPFDTVFEGNNFTIYNMRIDRASSRVGFFSTLNPAATIRNIRLEKVQVQGRSNTGGLVGYGQEATIINAQITGEVNGSNSVGGLIGNGERVDTINSRFIGSVNGHTNIGGLYGKGFYASLEDSSVIGNINGDNNHVGGLIGDGEGSLIINSSVTGIINGENRLGGLVGNGEGVTITNSSALINISGEDLIGGLIGNGARTEEISMIISSYAKGNIRGRNIVGGLIGQGESTAITTSYSIINITANDEVGGLVGSGYNAIITASYAITHITANDDIGGIIGLPSFASFIRDTSTATINATYAVATISGSGSYIGGLVGSRTDDINFIASYWDSNVNNLPSGSNDRAKTSEELQTPTSTSGIYSSWTQTCPGDGNKPVWNFGTARQYPAIVCTPHGVSPQR